MTFSAKKRFSKKEEKRLGGARLTHVNRQPKVQEQRFDAHLALQNECVGKSRKISLGSR